MPEVQAPAKILVTGASGFIAVWVVSELLDAGYTVVGTVRADEKGQYLKHKFKRHGDKFSYVIVEDIGKEGAFNDAVKGVDGIAHTASPFHAEADDPSELIDPAVDGTTHILEAALNHGSNVKRIVITSSVAAVHEPKKEPFVFTEKHWNEKDPKEVEEKGKDASGISKYQASKYHAEVSAWKFLEKNKAKAKFDIATVNPGLVFGPFFHDVKKPDSLNTSIKMLRTKIFGGETSEDDLLEDSDSWVDVRDVAAMHMLALKTKSAGGERFLASAGPYNYQEIFDALHEDPDLIADVTKGKPGAGNKSLDKRVYVSGEKATKQLGIKFRTLKESVRDTVECLKTNGWANSDKK